jgi:hypothetical protein
MRRIVGAFAGGAYSPMTEVRPVLLDRLGGRLGLPLEECRHPRQFGEAVGLHLGHYCAAMQFHGGLLDFERVGYLLVHLPFANEGHDFALARGQALLASTQFGQVGPSGGRFPSPDRAGDHFEPLLVAEWLLDEVDGAGLHGLD